MVNRVFPQMATSKGFISGDLCYMESDGTRISCSSSQAVAVSSNISGIRSILGSAFRGPGRTGVRACVFLDWRPDIVSSALFVLIVEKDATFQRLLDDDFCAKLSPCIMITVRFPSVFLLFFLGGGVTSTFIHTEFCSCLC